jgi:hypothetical protein
MLCNETLTMNRSIVAITFALHNVARISAGLSLRPVVPESVISPL